MSAGVSISKLFREMRERGLENTFQRFYSFYQATVTDMKDEKQLGRGRVCLDSIGYDTPSPGMADVLTPYGGSDYGFFFPPYKDDVVYVSFDHGDVSSPMIVGSYWGTSGQKRTTDSELPAEFVKSDGSAPTVRGIKVKAGSGLAFHETTDAVKVEMWTGASQGKGKTAEKHHKLTLDDTKDEERVVIATFGGHKTTWQDKTGEVYVKTTTIDGHEFLMDDTNEKVMIKTKQGHQALFDDKNQMIEVMSTGKSKFTIDDKKNVVTVRTVGGNQFTLDDSLKKIEGMTTGGRLFSMDDMTQMVKVVSPTPPQSVVISPTAGTTVSDASPGGVKVLATAGPLVGSGLGTSMTSLGQPAATLNTGVTNTTMIGAETKLLLGGSAQTIIGTWTLSGAFIASINALFILLGTGLQLRLVNESFFATAYNAHFHLTTIAGAPTSPPVVGLGIPGTHTTIQTFAS
jgi:hypothetical protein